MVTTSFYLDRRRKAIDEPGALNVVIRHNNQQAMMAVGNVRLLPHEWDGARVVNRPDQAIINKAVGRKKADIDSAIFSIALDRDLDGMSAAQIKEAVKDLLYPHQKKKPKDLFVPYYERFARRRNKPGTTDLYLQTLKKIRQFDPRIESKGFSEINKNWLEDFDDFLKQTTSQNIRNRHFRNMRAVFNDAVRAEYTPSSPFRLFVMPKLQPTRKRALRLEALKRLRDYPCMEWQKEYRDMFMLSFYLVGINMIDLLLARKEDVRDGRLEYRRAKTGKLYSIKIEPEAQAIIDRYPGKKYLLSPMDRHSLHKNYVQHMDRALQKIGLHYVTSRQKEGEVLFPGLSSYWARHTWSTLAQRSGVPLDRVGLALGHSWVTNSITAIYIDFDEEEVDRTNRLVLDMLK